MFERWGSLTRMEDGVQTHFPRPHKPTDLFQLAVPDQILEYDIVCEAHGPGGFEGYGRSKLYACPGWAALPGRLAIDGGVSGGGLVGRCVSRWSMVWWRMECSRAVLCGTVVSRRVRAAGVVWRCVMTGGVVCAGACVLWHRVLVAVLHSRRRHGFASPLSSRLKRRTKITLKLKSSSTQE